MAASNEPTHYVDVSATIEAGIASLREHAAYIEGLGIDFNPNEFLRDMAGVCRPRRGVRVLAARLPPLRRRIGHALPGGLTRKMTRASAAEVAASYVAPMYFFPAGQ